MICMALTGLSACKSSQQMMDNTVPADFELTIERTPCMGTCPYYDISVAADGSVKYMGKGHVKLMGERSKKLPQETLMAMASLIEAADFWKFDESYDNRSISDLPSVIMKCSMNGKSHRVLARFSAPKEFETLVLSLEELISAGGYDPILE